MTRKLRKREFALVIPWMVLVAINRGCSRLCSCFRTTAQPQIDIRPWDHIHDEEPVPLLSLAPAKGWGSITRDKLIRSQSQCLLLSRLPREIRYMILEMVLCDSQPTRLELGQYYIRDRPALAEKAGYKSFNSDLTKWPVKTFYSRFQIQGVWDVERVRPLSIMLTCRQAHHEGLPILYGQNSFVLMHEQFPCLQPKFRLDPVRQIHRFGEPATYHLIKHLSFHWPLVNELQDCEECKDLWNILWKRLRGMSALQILQIEFRMAFKQTDISWKVYERDYWKTCGSDWMKSKLLAMKQVKQFKLAFPNNLSWLPAAMNLDPARFRITVRPQFYYASW